MKKIQNLFFQLQNRSPCSLDEIQWPRALKLAVVAPHPDDFDAIAVCLKHFHKPENQLRLFVLSGGSKGVEDSFPGAGDWFSKARLREAEQTESCRLFGLKEREWRFLRFSEAGDGELADNHSNRDLLFSVLNRFKPDIAFLPYGKDYNTGHQRTYKMFRQFAAGASQPFIAFYNQDVKSTHFRTDLYKIFEQPEADWKSALLRTHKTQQQRNLNQRGYGFDTRVLGFNRQTAQDLKLTDGVYAETFQVELFPGER